MPSGPKKRRAARRKRGGHNSNHTEEELEDAVDLSESLSKVLEKSSRDTKADAVDEADSKKTMVESPAMVVESDQHVEKSKDVHDEITMLATVPESVIALVESSDSVGNKEKESESEHVDQILIQPTSKETKGEEIFKEAIVQDPSEEPTNADQDSFVSESISEVNVVETFIEDGQDSLKDSSLVELSPDQEGESEEPTGSSVHEPQAMVIKTVDQSVLEEISSKAAEAESVIEMDVETISLKDDQDSSVPVKSVSETNGEMSLEDGQDSLGSSSLVCMFLTEDRGIQQMVYHDVLVAKEGEEMYIEVVLEDSAIESPSLEPQEMIKTDVESVLNEEAQDPSADLSVVEVDVETISFEDAQETFETPLGSPSTGYTSPRFNDYLDKPIQDSVHEPNVIPLNEAQDPPLSKDVQDPIEEPPESSSMVDVPSVEGVAQGNEFSKVGESALDNSPAIVDHVESVVKENEEMPMEGVLEEPFVVAESVVTEEDIQTYSKDPKDSLEEPSRSLSPNDVSLVERVVQENGCGVGECACDSPLINFVVSEGEKMSLEGVSQAPFKEPTENSSHEPQEIVNTIDQSVVKAIYLKETHDPSESNDGVTSMEGVVPEKECDEVDDIACLDSPVIINHVQVLKENEEMAIDEVLEEENGRSSDESQEMDKTVDKLILEGITFKDIQDTCVGADSVSEVNVEKSSKDAEESSLKVPLGGSFGVIKGNEYDEVGESATLDNPFVLGMEDDEEMSVDGVLEEPSSHEPQEMVKTVDQVVLKNITLEEAHDPNELVMEANVETSSKDDFSTEGDDLGNKCDEVGEINHGLPVLVDGEMSTEYVVEEPLEENLETSIKDAQGSFEDPLENTFLVDTSLAESIVHGEESNEGGESAPMVDLVDSVMKENEEISIEGVPEEHFEDVLGDSSHEPEVMIKTVDQFVLKEVQVSSSTLESDTEVNIETSFKDSQDSLKEPLESPSVDDVSLSLNEGVVQGNKLAEVGENACHIVSVVNEGEEMSLEGVLQDDLEEVIESSSRELDAIVKTNDHSDLKVIPSKETQLPSLSIESISEVKVEESLKDVVEENEGGENAYHGSEEMTNHVMSMEGVLKDPIEEPSGISSHEPQEMVKEVDELVLKGLHLKEAQDPSVSVDSVIKVNAETISFEDAQDSFETPLGSPSVGHVSPLEGFVEWNDKTREPSHEPHVMVKTVEIPLEETQEPSLPVELVMEVNIETPLKVAKDQSSMESLGSLSMDDVSSMEDVVRRNECAEVGERSLHGELVSMEGVLEEPFKEPIKSSSDVQTTVNQDPSIQAESDFEANAETSVKDNQDSLKEQLVSPFMVDASHIEGLVEEKTSGEIVENATMVNEVESLKKKNEDLSLEGVLEESFKESIESSSNEQQKTPNTLDMSLQKEMPLKEAEDLSVPVQSFIEVNVETSSQVDVFHVGQRNGQRYEMVGLVRSLLEEIRRIRAFYEEGLRQTTQIDMQMLQILEKFDSGEQF